MKSYTDIEQSKVLTEILSHESADMYYHPYPNDEDWYDVPNIGNADLRYNQLPCWSLAALLGVLPLEAETHKQTDGYKVYYYVELYVKRMKKETYLSTERHENLVDACVEMILKLHELKLI